MLGQLEPTRVLRRHAKGESSPIKTPSRDSSRESSAGSHKRARAGLPTTRVESARSSVSSSEHDSVAPHREWQTWARLLLAVEEDAALNDAGLRQELESRLAAVAPAPAVVAAAAAVVVDEPPSVGVRAVREGARSDVDGALKDLERLQAETELLKAQLADATLRLKLRSGASESKLKGQVGDLEARLQELEQLLEQSEAARSTAEAELAARADAAAAAEATWKEERERSEARATRLLGTQMFEHRKALRELSERHAMTLSDQESRNTALVEMLAAAKARVGTLEVQIAELGERRETLEGALARAKDEKEDLGRVKGALQESLATEQSGHRACKTKLLACQSELRAARGASAAAEGKFAACEANLEAAHKEVQGLKESLARALERASEAEARAEYLRDASVREREARTELIEEAKGEIARRMTGQVIRLVVVAPTVNVMMGSGKVEQVKAAEPAGVLHQTLRQRLLPQFVRILTRVDEPSGKESSDPSKEPWITSLVEDLETGIKAQVRECFDVKVLSVDR
jgi:hypothetical protein